MKTSNMDNLTQQEQEALKAWEEENKTFIRLHKEGINPYAFVIGYKSAINKIKQEWISVHSRTPDLIDGKDYSENVWATDGKEVFIMSFCFVPDDGFYWSDCYMKADGDGDLCDDYGITHWMHFIIPTPPKQ